MSMVRTHPARFSKKNHPGVRFEEVSEGKKRDYLFQAGEIAAKVRREIASQVKPGASVFDLCMKADEMIFDAGAKIAFPVNISLNNVAAHYTGEIDDKLLIPDSGVIKVDVGVQIEGFIADTAESVDLDGKNKKLIEATKNATDTGIQLMRPGTLTGAVGGVIEKVIKDHGFNPVADLSGHLVDRYIVHAGKTIPCVEIPGGDQVIEGETYACETFASTGTGAINANINRVNIFRAAPVRVNPRNRNARKIVGIAINEFGGLPFASRWLLRHGMTKPQIAIGMRELQKTGNIIEYHVLQAESKDLISQHEHTFIVTKDGPEITTDKY